MSWGDILLGTSTAVHNTGRVSGQFLEESANMLSPPDWCASDTNTKHGFGLGALCGAVFAVLTSCRRFLMRMACVILMKASGGNFPTITASTSLFGRTRPAFRPKAFFVLVSVVFVPVVFSVYLNAYIVYGFIHLLGASSQVYSSRSAECLCP